MSKVAVRSERSMEHWLPFRPVFLCMPAQDDPLIDRFLDALWLEKGLSDNTRDAYRSDLALFNGWLGERNVRLVDVGRDAILDHLA